MRRFWKIIKLLLLACVILLVVDILIVVGFSIYRPAIPKTDAIIVLGAAINTPSLYNRSLQGLKLYQEGKGEVIVASGGRISDDDISEAAYISKVIKKNGDQAIPVILEDKSTDTYENIKFSKVKIPDATSIVIVSDDFHLARAVLMAKREGFAHVYWSSPQPYYYSKTDLVFYYFREIVAMIDYIPKFIKG
jgi:uncharacterized SAM-binding protein YcdF (DUF218 family)